MSLKSELSRFEPRQEQVNCVEFINNVYSKNKDVKFFLLNLPPGVGKSHLAMMITDWYLKTINGGAKFDIITNSKVLQNQYTNTYESINDLKGKENYTCATYDCTCAQGAEFAKLNKTKCDACPHSAAREGYFIGRTSLTNFYLYILYALYKPETMKARGSNVLIIDESQDFDDVMSDFISVKITESLIKKLKFSNDAEIIGELKSIKNISDYIDFLELLKKEIIATISDLERTMGSSTRSVISDRRNNRLSKIMDGSSTDVKIMSILSDLDQLLSKIEVFLTEYKENPDNWVLETHYNDKTKQSELSLEPIWAYDYLDKYVFSKYDMVFLMSGTILNKKIFCHLNGLDESKSVYYSISSPFPLKSRQIYYYPIGKMSYNKKEETFKKYIPAIQKILNKYSDKKGIIHTNSFELSNWISQGVKDKRLIFHDSSNKDEVLQKHYESKKPSVIVSPSMDTGVSFDGDKGRFQIIAKIPYPSLASQKNKLRQQTNPDWYSWKTCCNLIQASGRCNRSVDDYSDTIIIDESFGDVLRYSNKFIPSWFQEAIRSVPVKS